MSFPVDPSTGRASRSVQGVGDASAPATSAEAPAVLGGGTRPSTFGGVRLPSNPGEQRARAKQERTEPNVALRYLSAAAVGVAAGVRCLMAVGTLTLSERIAGGIDQLQARWGSTGVDAEAVAKDLVTASLAPEPGEPDSRLLHASALPTRVPAHLQGGTRDVTTANVCTALAKKIDAGAALFAAIQQGRPTGPCTDGQASDLIWFFEAQCQLRGRADGLSVSLGDEQGLVQAFLETHPGVYSLPNGGRGIDFYGTNPQTLDGVLPRALHALVFHPGRPGAKEDPNRLFLGLAPHGAFLSTGGDATGPHRLGNRHDVGAFIARTADGLRESLGLKTRPPPPRPVRLDPYSGAEGTIPRGDRIAAVSGEQIKNFTGQAAELAAAVRADPGLEDIEVLLRGAQTLAAGLGKAGDLRFSTLRTLQADVASSLQSLVRDLGEKVGARRREIEARPLDDPPSASLRARQRDLRDLEGLLTRLAGLEDPAGRQLTRPEVMGADPRPEIAAALADLAGKIASHEAVDTQLAGLVTATAAGRRLASHSGEAQLAAGVAQHQAGAAALAAATALTEVTVAGRSQRLTPEAAERLTPAKVALAAVQAELAMAFGDLLDAEIAAMESPAGARWSQPGLAEAKARLEARQETLATDLSGLISAEIRERLGAALARVTRALADLDANLAATQFQVQAAMVKLIAESRLFLGDATLTKDQVPLAADLLGRMQPYSNRTDAAVGGHAGPLAASRRELAARLAAGVAAELARWTGADAAAATPLERFQALLFLANALPESGPPEVVALRARVTTAREGLPVATVQVALDELAATRAAALQVDEPGERAAKLLELMGRSIALTAHAGALAREAKTLRDALAGEAIAALEAHRDALRTMLATAPAEADQTRSRLELTASLRRLERGLQEGAALGRRAWPEGTSAPVDQAAALRALQDDLPEVQWRAARLLVGPKLQAALTDQEANLSLASGYNLPVGPAAGGPREALLAFYRAGALGNARLVEKMDGLFSGGPSDQRVLPFVQALAAGDAASLNAFLHGPEWDDLALSLKREGALQRAMAPAGATVEERAEANERIARALATVELEHQLHVAKRALELTLRAQDGWRPLAKTAEQLKANPAKFAPGGFQALVFDQRTVASLSQVSGKPPLNAIAGCNLLIAQLAVQEQAATLQRENRTLTPEGKTALAGLVRTLVGGTMAHGKTDDEVLALAQFGASFKSTRELEQLAAAFGEFAQKITAAQSGPLLKALAEYRADQGDGRPDAALVVDRISAHTLQRAQAGGGAQFEANPTAKLYAEGWIAATVTLGTAPRVKLQHRMERIGNLVNNRPPDLGFLQGVAAKLAVKGMDNPAATGWRERAAAAVSSVVNAATGEAGRSVFQTYLGVKSEGFRTNPAPTLDPGKVDLANVRKLGEYVGQGVSLHSAPLVTALHALSATMASLAHHENQGAARQRELTAQLAIQSATLKASIPRDAFRQADIRRLADAFAAASGPESREVALNHLKNLVVAEPLRVRLATLATLVATLDTPGNNGASVRGEIAAFVSLLQAGLPEDQPMNGHFGRLLEELKTAVASGTPAQRGAAVDRLTGLVDLGAGAHTIYQAQKTAVLYNLQPSFTGKLLHAIPGQGTSHTAWLSGFPPPPENAAAVAQIRGAGRQELEKLRRDAPELWRLAGGAMLDYFSESSYTDLAVFRADLLGVARPDGSLADPALTTALGAGLDQHLAGLALNNIGNAAGGPQSQALSLIKLSLFVHESADSYLAALKDGLPEVADISKKTSGALHAHLLGYAPEASLLTQAVNGLHSGEMLEIEISSTGTMRVKAPVAAGVSATGGISATRANSLRITKEGDSYVVAGKTAHHGAGSVGLRVFGDRLSAVLNAGGGKAAGFVLEFNPRTTGREGPDPAARVGLALSAMFSARTRVDALGALHGIGADRIRTVDEAGAFIGVEANVSLNAKLPGDLEFVSLDVGLSAAAGADIRTRTEANAFECRRTTAKSWEVAATASLEIGVINPFADAAAEAGPEEEHEPTPLSEVRDQGFAARAKADGARRTVFGGAGATPPASHPSRDTALWAAKFKVRATDERAVVTRSGVVVGDTFRRRTIQIESGTNYDEDNARANFDRMLQRLGATRLIPARLQGNLDTMRSQRPTAIALRYNLTPEAVHAIAGERAAGRAVEKLLTADASYELAAIEFTVPGADHRTAIRLGSDDVGKSAAGVAEDAATAQETAAEGRVAMADVAVAGVDRDAAGEVLDVVGEAATELAEALGGISLSVKYDRSAGITLSKTYTLDLRADAIAA